jgi:hypothetical protein
VSAKADGVQARRLAKKPNRETRQTENALEFKEGDRKLPFTPGTRFAVNPVLLKSVHLDDGNRDGPLSMPVLRI